MKTFFSAVLAPMLLACGGSEGSPASDFAAPVATSREELMGHFAKGVAEVQAQYPEFDFVYASKVNFARWGAAAGCDDGIVMDLEHPAVLGKALLTYAYDSATRTVRGVVGYVGQSKNARTLDEAEPQVGSYTHTDCLNAAFPELQAHSEIDIELFSPNGLPLLRTHLRQD